MRNTGSGGVFKVAAPSRPRFARPRFARIAAFDRICTSADPATSEKRLVPDPAIGWTSRCPKRPFAIDGV
jgi:hypothetical protein